MKTIFFTIADQSNLPYAKMMERSLKFFHPDAELKIFGSEDIKRITHPEPFYVAKAFFGKELAEDYEQVINIDADSLVVGSLDEVLASPYEVGCVLNNAITIPDPLERQICSLDRTNPAFYMNAGFVSARSTRFWNWWHALNQRHFFQAYQFREQDTLNMIFHYGDLLCVNFDNSASIYGLWLNGYWPRTVLENGEIVLPSSVLGARKPLKILHWGGGKMSAKMNYRTKFPAEVADRIAEIIA